MVYQFGKTGQKSKAHSVFFTERTGKDKIISGGKKKKKKELIWALDETRNSKTTDETDCPARSLPQLKTQ